MLYIKSINTHFSLLTVDFLNFAVDNDKKRFQKINYGKAISIYNENIFKSYTMKKSPVENKEGKKEQKGEKKEVKEKGEKEEQKGEKEEEKKEQKGEKEEKKEEEKGKYIPINNYNKLIYLNEFDQKLENYKKNLQKIIASNNFSEAFKETDIFTFSIFIILDFFRFKN